MLDDYSAIGTYIYNVVDSIIEGNTFGYTRFVSCANLKIVNNNFISSTTCAVILDGSHECFLSDNYYSTYYASSNATVLSFYGGSCLNNRSYHDTFIRSINNGGVYTDETIANNNVVQLKVVSNFEYPYLSPLTKALNKNLSSNITTFTLTPSFIGIGIRISATIAYTLLFCDGTNNNTPSRIVTGDINFNLLLDATPYLPAVTQIITNVDTAISISASGGVFTVTVTLSNNTVFTNCVGIFESKGVGAKQLLLT